MNQTLTKVGVCKRHERPSCAYAHLGRQQGERVTLKSDFISPQFTLSLFIFLVQRNIFIKKKCIRYSHKNYITSSYLYKTSLFITDTKKHNSRLRNIRTKSQVSSRKFLYSDLVASGHRQVGFQLSGRSCSRGYKSNTWRTIPWITSAMVSSSTGLISRTMSRQFSLKKRLVVSPKIYNKNQVRA
jgi:hypothetical protein